VRLVHSRDERHGRSPADPPAWRDAGRGRRAIWPRDPDGGGTWIAARDDGLVLAIMNVNPTPPPAQESSRLRSRGAIIPALIEADLEEIEGQMVEMNAAAFAPFRLVATLSTTPEIRSWTWRGTGNVKRAVAATPACWATSGLGDEAVAPRLELFEEMLARDPMPETQDAFHRHRWHDRPEISVLMERADARTVSITTVDLPGAERPAMEVSTIAPYAASAPDEGA